MTPVNPPLAYMDDIETIPPGEAEDIQRVVAALEVLLSRNQAKSGRFAADVHVKAHGYAQGEFRVLPNLPGELAQGLFEHDRVYQAQVRFSNAASHAQSDAIPDGRGLAIKVSDVTGDLVLPDDQKGSTQDFVMINHPVFFARNVHDYLRLEQVLVQADDNSLATLQGALTGGDWNPLHWHWREMLTVARIAGQLPAHPASNTYFSMAPIRFGNYVAKYRAKPAGDRHDSYLELFQRLGSQADALRLVLEETLRTQQVLFEFQVQLRTSERTMPIEDASIEWPESESPFRTVAHLLLPRQEIALLRQQAAYQSLAFNVWHALASHRPLGGINRVRQRAYEVSSAWRRQRVAIDSVFDKPMCCSTGVCGPKVDPVLPRFAADLAWLKSQGHQVERFNLAQQPAAFVQNPEVQQLLATQGTDCLPLITVDGRILSRRDYPSRDTLAKWVG